MSPRRFVRTLLTVIFLAVTPIHLAASQKLALLIGISEYPEVEGSPELKWADIHGVNDIDLTAPVLRQKGFKTSILVNSEATAENIRKAFMALEAEAAAGDIVYIHFSGHGQAVEDTNGDEPDGWDEAIIPYDALTTYRKGVYEGECHILDDDLEKYFNAVRKKIGSRGFLYVVLDACHMGGRESRR